MKTGRAEAIILEMAFALRAALLTLESDELFAQTAEVRETIHKALAKAGAEAAS